MLIGASHSKHQVVKIYILMRCSSTFKNLFVKLDKDEI